jgi:flagellar FliL protein
MSATPLTSTDTAAKGRGNKKLLPLLLAVLAVAVLAVGLSYVGVIPAIPGLPGLAHRDPSAQRAAAGTDKGREGEAAAAPPTFLDMPEIVSNLNAGPRRTSYLKLHVKIELAKADDQVIATTAMPRLLDLFQTYLRDMRPDDLRGSEGTYRLREELIARANIAIAPAHVVNVLFTEMLVQ